MVVKGVLMNNKTLKVMNKNARWESVVVVFAAAEKKRVRKRIRI